MEGYLEKIQAATNFIKERAGDRKPLVGIILGSGLGNLADRISDRICIPYKDIPEFPISTVIGHKGNLIIGELGGKTVVAMQGRFHYYEGYDMARLTLPTRVMKLLGIEYLFVSNAAGATNTEYNVGDMVIIRDHINNMPNPLIGANLDDFGPRFPDMTCAYSPKLIAKAEGIAAEMGLKLHKGVYLASSGPTYETPAEVRFFKTIGADLLGMSTIPEVIVARHCGISVFGMSVVTNIANIENTDKKLNDAEDVIRQADLTTQRMSELFIRLIQSLQ